MHTQVDLGEPCPGFWALEDYDILLLPSITVSFYETRKLSSIHEERHLVMLNLLKNKNCRIIFVMSTPLDADIIKYRLNIYKKAYHDPTAEQRLILLDAGDPSNRPLTDKIMENEELIKQIQSHIRNRDKSIMLSYICGERDLALRNKLGIPHWFGSSSQSWGTKSGSRQTFKESGVPIAEGLMRPVYLVQKVKEHTLRLLQKTRAQRLIVKMDDGSGGYGNVVLDFSGIDLDKVTMDDIYSVLKSSVEKVGTFDQFTQVVEQSGVIIEEMMDPSSSQKQTTPSVQLFIQGEDKVQVLSSHEQVVDGCIYLGCRYPASKCYLDTITKYSYNVGKTLSKKGVRGFLGVDFLANHEDETKNEWDLYALEINIRLCATTFAYFLLLTVVPEEEVSKKHYMMLDEVHLGDDIKSFHDLDRALAHKGLAYDWATGRGVLLATCGRIATHHEVSVMIVADSRRAVDKLLAQFLRNFAAADHDHPAPVLAGFSPIASPEAAKPDLASTSPILDEEREKLPLEAKYNEQGEVVV